MTEVRHHADPSGEGMSPVAEEPVRASAEPSAPEPSSGSGDEEAEPLSSSSGTEKKPLPEARLMSDVDPRTGRRRSSTRRRIRKLEAQLRIFQGGVGLLGLLLFASVINQFLVAHRHDRSIQSMSYEVDAQRARTEKLTKERDEAQAELASAVAGRIPGLREIVWNERTPIQHGYVKSGLFELTRALDGNRIIKYQLSLDNASEHVVVPEVDLVIFDRRGFEIGRALLMLGSEGRGDGGRALRAHGESSIDGRIILDPETEPGFFVTYLDGD